MTGTDRSEDPSPAVDQNATASDQAQVYQAGRDQTINQVVLPEGALRPVTEVAAPPGLVNVPRVGLFVGRTEELAAVEAALATDADVVIAAVHGLGGVGKSTLAAHYARHHLTSRNPVWWITADSPDAVLAGLAALTAALQPELATAPLEILTERATTWLATHQNWLLVLDNVTDPADINTLLTRANTGRILVTSRLADSWDDLPATVIKLDVLTENEAITLLRRRAALPPSDPATDADRPTPGIKALVDELGCLPLAVEQAAAYLRQTRTTPAQYLELLAERPAVMYDRAALGADGERTVARIWRLTLDALADVPLAGQLLRALAWYGAEAVPRSVLAPMADLLEVDAALGALAAYNMVTLTRDAVTVHRLVQAVARTADPADPHRQPGDIAAARDQATSLLNQARSGSYDNPADWPIWRSLLPHIEALADHTTPDTDTIPTARLLNWTGVFIREQGAVRRAITYLERGLAAYRRLLGGDDPDILTSRDNLANAYWTAGDLGRAIPLFEATLADRERVLGGDHPDTLTSRNNLASAYQAAGDLRRAIPLFEATLADCERVLGGDHPDTLNSRNNLAYAYQAAGNLGRAIPLYEATLADRERVLGDHPDTLISRNNLAHAYRAAGNLGRAIPMLEATLADRERVLGGDHPDTLVSRNGLAYAYQEAGDLGRAIPLYEATLADRERVLGGDHPSTLTSRNNLAYAYQEAGDLGRAIPLYAATLADCVRVLGGDHPDTLSSRNNLAGAYQEAGDLGRAIPLLEQALASCERVLGASHPLTKTVRRNLEVARSIA